MKKSTIAGLIGGVVSVAALGLSAYLAGKEETEYATRIVTGDSDTDNERTYDDCADDVEFEEEA